MATKKKDNRWMEKAAARMKRKGSKGSFGKATGKKIKRALKKGGKTAKKAAFAKAAKKVAARHK